MMKTKILIFIIFLSFLNMPIIGQTVSDSVNYNSIKSKYALGFGAGFTTGYGMSFKFTPNKFGLQTNFAPLYTHYQTRYSIGVTILYTLFEDERSSFYLYQANNFMYSKMSDYVNTYFNNGFGFGIELVFIEHFGLNLMAGYGASRNFEQLSITGETGIYYKF
jgi:hypothetical protein